MHNDAELVKAIEDRMSSVKGDERNLFRKDKVALAIKNVVTRWGNWRRKLNQIDSINEQIKMDEELSYLLVQYVMIHMGRREYEDAAFYTEKLRNGSNLNKEEVRDRIILKACADVIKLRHEHIGVKD